MRKGDKNWRSDEVAFIARRWNEGVSASSIAAELGPDVTKGMVIGLIYRRRLNGLSLRKRSPQNHRARDRIVQLRTAGLRNCEIARRLGITDETVWSTLKEAMRRGELAAALDRQASA